MTRWARRGGDANKKKPLEATPWEQMTQGNSKDEVSKASTSQAKELSTQKKRQKKHASSSDKMVNESGVKSGKVTKKKKKKSKSTAVVEVLKWNQDSDKSSGKSLAAELEMLQEETKTYDPEMDWFIESHQAHKSPSKSQMATQGKFKLVSELEKLKASSSLTADEQKEVDTAIRKDQRREKRRLKRVQERANAQVCFHCREAGHTVADCPQVSKDVEHGVDICFKCGSTEHRLEKCRVNLPPGHYPYAKCFICKETGHLSKQCPDNPRGLYPKGGCCRECGAVDHFRKDCPELSKKKGSEDMKLATLDCTTSMDEERSFQTPPSMQKKKHGPKLVKF